MAPPDEDFKSRNRRQEREEEEKGNEELSLAQKRTGSTGAPTKPGSSSMDASQFESLSVKAEASIRQIDSLYNQYVGGVEKTPPNEARKQLEQVMFTLQNTAKMTASLKFRFTNLLNTYSTHKDKWDKLMRDLDSGKVLRRKGPVK